MVTTLVTDVSVADLGFGAPLVPSKVPWVVATLVRLLGDRLGAIALEAEAHKAESISDGASIASGGGASSPAAASSSSRSTPWSSRAALPVALAPPSANTPFVAPLAMMLVSGPEQAPRASLAAPSQTAPTLSFAVGSVAYMTAPPEADFASNIVAGDRVTITGLNNSAADGRRYVIRCPSRGTVARCSAAVLRPRDANDDDDDDDGDVEETQEEAAATAAVAEYLASHVFEEDDFEAAPPSGEAPAHSTLFSWSEYDASLAEAGDDDDDDDGYAAAPAPPQPPFGEPTRHVRPTSRRGARAARAAASPSSRGPNAQHGAPPGSRAGGGASAASPPGLVSFSASSAAAAASASATLARLPPPAVQEVTPQQVRVSSSSAQAVRLFDGRLDTSWQVRAISPPLASSRSDQQFC